MLARLKCTFSLLIYGINLIVFGCIMETNPIFIFRSTQGKCVEESPKDIYRIEPASSIQAKMYMALGYACSQLDSWFCRVCSLSKMHSWYGSAQCSMFLSAFHKLFTLVRITKKLAGQLDNYIVSNPSSVNIYHLISMNYFHIFIIHEYFSWDIFAVDNMRLLEVKHNKCNLCVVLCIPSTLLNIYLLLLYFQKCLVRPISTLNSCAWARHIE